MKDLDNLEVLKLHVASLETLARLDARELEQTQAAMQKAQRRIQKKSIDPWFLAHIEH